MGKLVYRRALMIITEQLDKKLIRATFEHQRLADIETTRSRGDYRTAEAMRVNFEKQIGLGPTDKLEVTITENDEPDMSEFSEDELKKLLAVKPKAAPAK